MAPTVTAVVCAGWRERLDNVRRIVSDLQHGSVAPDTIIVLNNLADSNPRWEGVRVLHAWNTECRGKYVAALFAYADFYLLLDDDMTVRRGTVQYLLSQATAGSVIANRGVQLIPGEPLSSGVICDSPSAGIPTRVDVLYGSAVFASHQALVRTFAAEQGLRTKWPAEGDDILVGLVNRPNSWVLPCSGDAGFEWLSDGGVAMQHHADYFQMRDRFTADAVAHLGQGDPSAAPRSR